MSGHISVVVNNSEMLGHNSVGVDNFVMLGHSSVGVDNFVMLGHNSVEADNSVMLDHGSVGVDNFVEAHSFFHPLAWTPDHCKRDSLESLALGSLVGCTDQDFYSGLVFPDFSHTVPVEVGG